MPWNPFKLNLLVPESLRPTGPEFRNKGSNYAVAQSCWGQLAEILDESGFRTLNPKP